MTKRDIVVCPKCKIEMVLIEQRGGAGIAKCEKCTFAISVEHWMLADLIKLEEEEDQDAWQSEPTGKRN